MDLSFDLENIHEAARLFWESSAGATIFAFHGEMGVGKTTFIRALVQSRGVTDPVSSPTFAIINEYQGIGDQGFAAIYYHLDLYRLEDLGEAIRAGVEDCLNGPDTCFIEWPEIITDVLPEATMHIYLTVQKDQKRRLLTD
ncbi:MAG TPA: tRNA (adenosine(37)-N6)-threonylcarbamoyltransferase complex ATPase subunit type 1 TsaE [Chitinophagaceae bacterium]|nr:tRNA (adenosine(37)-N6)-threonylcarbamoyltransferase complex ATPase subunit type 1 TsaE [Chitinophagaceae bacterium]